MKILVVRSLIEVIAVAVVKVVVADLLIFSAKSISNMVILLTFTVEILPINHMNLLFCMTLQQISLFSFQLRNSTLLPNLIPRLILPLVIFVQHQQLIWQCIDNKFFYSRTWQLKLNTWFRGIFSYYWRLSKYSTIYSFQRPKSDLHWQWWRFESYWF